MEDLKDKLIQSILVDKSNFKHIASSGKINGTLLVEIKRVMETYLNENLKDIMKARSPKTVHPQVFGPRNEDC